MSEYTFGTVSWLELVVVLACAIVVALVISSKQKPVVEEYKERLAKAKEIVDYYINNNTKLMNEWKVAIESEDKDKEDIVFYKITELATEKLKEYNIPRYEMLLIIYTDRVVVTYKDYIMNLIKKHDKKK